MGFGIKIVRSSLDHGDSAIETRTRAAACFQAGATVPFPVPPDVVPPVPKPPQQTASPEAIRKGAALYGKFVRDGCHSPGIDGSGAWVLNGAVPDLRYAPADVHRDWYGIVLAGTHWDKGMPGFADPPKFAFPNLKMTLEDADAIHAYVIDQAWKAYKEEQHEPQANGK